MSTLDATVSMVQRCTEEELQVVQQVIRQFFLNRSTQTTTKSQFLEELDISRKQYADKAHKTHHGKSEWRYRTPGGTD